MEKQTQKTTSQPPISPPKEKLKRKLDERNNSSMATLFSSNEQIQRKGLQDGSTAYTN